ncbi:hypothetical protein L596_021820 [Steinernema carpocapsae]|uniref:Uncharacterized protein n=1 Tax=Steinernema carpocapsae TaxID=34508 RepID=A0A4U5MJV9_STECR|nr:hypothetical protein L596_021820 [Steinernema carpocapsae]
MSTQSSTPVVNTVKPTHHGFSAKAREILLDPPGTSTMQQQQAKLGNLSPIPSSNSTSSLRRLFGLAKCQTEGELRRAILNGCAALKRTDSQSTQKSVSSTQSSPVKDQEFDGIDDFPKVENSKKKFLGDIGKTKSAGDMFRKNTIIKTFQQQNIMRLPSVDSDLEGASRFRNIVQRDDSFDSVGSFTDIFDGQSARKSTYQMK